MKRNILAFVTTLFCISLLGSHSYAANYCQCPSYTRCATGINIYGNGHEWDNKARSAGYFLSSTPVVGGAMNFEKGAYGADKNYGHVGKVMSYSSDGNYWKIKLRHVNWPASKYFKDACGCDNTSEKEFRVKKGDNNVHYIVIDLNIYSGT